jgi:hypothetical protein
VTWRRLAIGLALFPAWLAVVFVVSLFYGGEEYPPLSGGIVVAVVMAGVTWLLASKVTLPGPKAAALGVCWLFGFVALQLFITIPNGTVDVIFGSATTYLTYAGMVAGLVLAARRRCAGGPPRARRPAA